MIICRADHDTPPLSEYQNPIIGGQQIQNIESGTDLAYFITFQANVEEAVSRVISQKL